MIPKWISIDDLSKVIMLWKKIMILGQKITLRETSKTNYYNDKFISLWYKLVNSGKRSLLLRRSDCEHFKDFV